MNITVCTVYFNGPLLIFCRL